jgi:hypothetical protein
MSAKKNLKSTVIVVVASSPSILILIVKSHKNSTHAVLLDFFRLNRQARERITAGCDIGLRRTGTEGCDTSV